MGAIDARDLRQLHLFDRVRQAEVEARRKLAGIGAEAQHDAELVRVDANGEAKKAYHRHDNHGDQEDSWAAHAAAGHSLANPVLALAQNLF